LVDNLHVALAYQRQGLGARLMKSVAEVVGDDPMYLWVLEQNAAAQAFYRSLGGQVVESVAVDPPGGNATRLNGSPQKLRMWWPKALELR
jgi:ribosomal protein S18 acetylase RimI-like enzyme